MNVRTVNDILFSKAKKKKKYPNISLDMIDFNKILHLSDEKLYKLRTKKSTLT